MSRKPKTPVTGHPRVWYDLTQCNLEDINFIELLESGSPEAVLDIIQKYLQPNEYIKVESIRSENTTSLQNYLNQLREAGLDVGKGDCQYGYRMPHVKNKGFVETELHIFRRR